MSIAVASDSTVVDLYPRDDRASGVDGIDVIGRRAGRWPRVFTKADIHPYEEIEWKIVDASIKKPDGTVVFEQKGIEVPSWWSQTTIDIVADKYFRVIKGTRENSAKQMFSRVCSVLRRWAEEQNYFETSEDAQIYEEELIFALLHQYGAFNSPVWFNLGIPGRRQAASACFISSVEDTLDGIMDFQKAEVTIFRGGSGSGANLSDLRSSYEKISSGSYTSGPLSWMEGTDKYAKAMKSGGSTRNAAKMVILDMDHPDILQTRDGRPGFIRSKSWAEQMAHDLINAGYSCDYDDPVGAYKVVPYQNANHSISIPDAFMKAVEDDLEWTTKKRSTGEVVHTYKARALWKEVADAAWFCGDPGIQFSDTINKWHTTPENGKIKSSNPCFHPDTRIATEHGLVRIEDLCSEFESNVLESNVFKILVQTQDGPVLKDAIVFPTGVKNVVEVHTKRGRVLKVTPDHRLMTTDGWTEARDLTEDSSLCLQVGPAPISPRSSGLELMWHKIAGWISGDGWILKEMPCRNTHEVGLIFGKDDKDVMESVLSYLSALEVPFSAKRQDGSVGESPDYVRIRRKNIWEMMSTWACDPGSKAPTKKVPEAVFRAGADVQLAFLSGLFSADGTFNIQPKKNVDARFSSTSLDLLRGVQSILLNLGVNSTIYKDRRPNDKPTFSYTSKSGEVRTYFSKEKTNDLVITGQSLRTFKELMLRVGLLSARKQSRFDDIPADVNNYGRDRWTDEIIKVVDNGEIVPVYDITESETHSLIADGVIAHNCSEFLHVDNTACNLCALNLTKFFDGSELQVKKFEHAIRLFVTAQNAIIAKADYPTAEITKNSYALRPIGLNYGDLGALLMNLGYGYDSNEGRAVAARMASLMTGNAYLVSAKLAARTAPFSDFEKNHKPMIDVMRMHADADQKILSRWGLNRDPISDNLPDITSKLWEDVISFGDQYGFTISQATLQAPLGTISFLMGMSTTGIEPAFSLISYKKLVGGGTMKIVNAGVRDSLAHLNYSAQAIDRICNFVEERAFIEGAPDLKPEHLSVFDCAMPSGPSNRCISPLAHIKMMAAIQPLITCAQSKTVNLQSDVTAEAIADIYFQSWKLGVKCVALYRDGCKWSQPMATTDRAKEQGTIKADEIIAPVAPLPPVVYTNKRRHMPEDRSGTTHRFEINGHKGYITVNQYDDGTPGEVFLRLGKNGSTMSGLIDGFTQLLSIALQYGVPLDKLVRSFTEIQFEPAGYTRNPRIRFARSLYDYLFKYLDIKYLNGETSGMAEHSISDSLAPPTAASPRPPSRMMDGPPCTNCGGITHRNGSCYLCSSCGTTTGCS